MKFYKLVKSIDYVTFPSYVELKKLNKTLGDSTANLRNILLSALVSFIFQISSFSQWLINKYFVKSSVECLVAFSKNEEAGKMVSVFIGIVIFLILWGCRFIDSRWGSNKDTVDERTEIVFTFYKVIIPNLIALKSIIQQHDESDYWDIDKRYLLLLQAKYEVCRLIEVLNSINVVEINTKTKIITVDAKSVLDQIGPDAYFTVLLDLLNYAKGLIDRLYDYKEKEILYTIKSLITTVFASKALYVCGEKSIMGSYKTCVEIIKMKEEFKQYKIDLEEPS